MSDLVKTIKVGSESRELGVKWDNVENQPTIPAAYDDTEVKADIANNLAVLRVLAKAAGKEDELAENLYADYPHITLVLGEHVNFVKILKGKPNQSRGFVPATLSDTNKVTISYNKDGNGYDVGNDAQFNVFVKVDEGYTIPNDNSTLSADDSTKYNGLKVNDLDKGVEKYVPVDGETLVNATKVTGSFILTINAKAIEPVTQE